MLDLKELKGVNVILKDGTTTKIVDATISDNNYIKVTFETGIKCNIKTSLEKGIIKIQNEILVAQIFEASNIIEKDANALKEKKKEENRIINEQKAKEYAEKAKTARERLDNNPTKSKSKRSNDRSSKYENKRNIAYKATYCDGNGNWFRRPCSLACMERNIYGGRSWCNESLCKQYMIGKASMNDINKKWETDLCYESRILEDYSVSAGLDKKTKRARDFAELDVDRLVILTTVEPECDGKDRIIFGAFLVQRIIPKKEFVAAKAISYPDCRLELTIEEARQMRFWDYYQNENNPASTQWGTGLFRNLYDVQAAKILRDIVEIILNSNRTQEEKDKAQAFLDRFLSIIGKTISQI